MSSGRVLVVDLAWRRCDCGHFQVERLPCRHVIMCCANQRLDWQVYVSDVYKMSEIRKGVDTWQLSNADIENCNIDPVCYYGVDTWQGNIDKGASKLGIESLQHEPCMLPACATHGQNLCCFNMLGTW
ncbi:hypothetical protein AHAS_Ahas13G0339300 [Arachis hypogaea]